MTQSTKVFTGGTHRVRHPEETLAIMAPRLADYGITRVSDVTGLDALAIPVAMAARPLSWTVSVSQGKGQTMTLAKVSAVMESVELWHAERTTPPSSHVRVRAADLDLPYTLADLSLNCGAFLSDRTPMDWIDATGMISGRRVPVPKDAVMFPDPRAQHWTPASIRTNSNGLASGNTRDEAALHALYEVVERDVLCRLSQDEVTRLPSIDPKSIPDDTCLAMVGSVLEAGGRISVRRLHNPYEVPTYQAVVWSWDFPIPCGGHGSHADPVVAASRALTEAAQGRLAAIVGTRDDLENFYSYLDKPRRKVDHFAQFIAVNTTFDAAEDDAPRHQYEDISEELAWLTRRVSDVTGFEPLMVDLSTEDAFSVVKVLVPGGVFEGSRVHSRLEPTA